MNTLVDQLADPIPFAPPTTTIRPGSGSDEQSLTRLSQLEDKHAGTAPHLVAEQDGEIVASLSLADDVALGDPFRPTAAVIDLLRLFARQADPNHPDGWRLAKRLTALSSAVAAWWSTPPSQPAPCPSRELP